MNKFEYIRFLSVQLFTIFIVLFSGISWLYSNPIWWVIFVEEEAEEESGKEDAQLISRVLVQGSN